MLEILDRICEGEGREGDLERLDELASAIKDSALCGLGQTCPNPVLSTIRNFRNEYEEHIYEGFCRSGICKDLYNLYIDPELCNGCTRCSKTCAVGAISGDKKEVHQLDVEVCTKCGSCIDKCRQDAIRITRVGREADVSN